MNNNCLQAVHDDDLRKLLSSLGVLESVEAGEQRCVFCGCDIKEENIGAVLPLDNKIAFSCDKQACIDKMIEMRDL